MKKKRMARVLFKTTHYVFAMSSQTQGKVTVSAHQFWAQGKVLDRNPLKGLYSAKVLVSIRVPKIRSNKAPCQFYQTDFMRSMESNLASVTIRDSGILVEALRR